MGPGETIDTGQKEVKQKKFVSIKQKIAAKKLKKHGAKKPTKSTGPKTSAATPLFDNDPVSANSTIGSANRPPQFPAKKNSGLIFKHSLSASTNKNHYCRSSSAWMEPAGNRARHNRVALKCFRS